MKKDALLIRRTAALERILKKQTMIAPKPGVVVIHLAQALMAMAEAFDAGALEAIKQAGDTLDQGDKLQELLVSIWASGTVPGVALGEREEEPTR